MSTYYCQDCKFKNCHTGCRQMQKCVVKLQAELDNTNKKMMDAYDEQGRLFEENKRLTAFARFVIASIHDTCNAGLVWTNTPHNILAGAKQALESEVKK